MSPKLHLTENDYAKAAAKLKCSVAAVKAVACVESSNSGFLSDNTPIILFEPHIFSQQTQGRFNKSHPKLSYSKWGTLPYGSKNSQHAKLAEAVTLDREAALKSCSWGMFQVMGFNWTTCGYKNVQELVNAAYKGLDGHLDMFVRYIEGRGLADELQRLDWAGFARGYNGPSYAVNRYDTKLAKAYKSFC